MDLVRIDVPYAGQEILVHWRRLYASFSTLEALPEVRACCSLRAETPPRIFSFRTATDIIFWCLKVASTYYLKTSTSGSSGIAHPSVIICCSLSASCAA